MKRDISDLKNDISGLKSDFPRLDFDIQVTRNVNTKLPERLVTMERSCYAKKQYSRSEFLEILGITESVVDNGHELKVLEILEENDVSIDPSSFGDCHRLASEGWSKKSIIKSNRCKDIHRISLNKNKLNNLNSESVNLLGETKAFITESLCLY